VSFPRNSKLLDNELLTNEAHAHTHYTCAHTHTHIHIRGGSRVLPPSVSFPRNSKLLENNESTTEVAFVPASHTPKFVLKEGVVLEMSGNLHLQETMPHRLRRTE